MQPLRFLIEAVVDSGFSAVFAKQLGEGKFKVAEGSLLGDVPLKPRLNMPYAIDSEGEPRLDVFAFYPLRKTDIARFSVGDVVSLVVPGDSDS